MNAALVSEIRRLTAEEKLQLVEDLWDELSAAQEPLKIPAWHLQALAEDQSAYQAKPDEGSSWADVKQGILGKP